MDSPPSSEPDGARGSSLSTSSSQFGVPAPRFDSTEGDDTPASRAGPLFASTHVCGCRPGVLFTPPRWLCRVCEGTGATPHTPPSPAPRGLSSAPPAHEPLGLADRQALADDRSQHLRLARDYGGNAAVQQRYAAKLARLQQEQQQQQQQQAQALH